MLSEESESCELTGGVQNCGTLFQLLEDLQEAIFHYQVGP